MRYFNYKGQILLKRCSRLGKEVTKTNKAYRGEGRDRIPNVAGFFFGS